jgi:hypothetical protein
MTIRTDSEGKRLFSDPEGIRQAIQHHGFPFEVKKAAPNENSSLGKACADVDEMMKELLT